MADNGSPEEENSTAPVNTETPPSENQQTPLNTPITNITVTESLESAPQNETGSHSNSPSITPSEIPISSEAPRLSALPEFEIPFVGLSDFMFTGEASAQPSGNQTGEASPAGGTTANLIDPKSSSEDAEKHGTEVTSNTNADEREQARRQALLHPRNPELAARIAEEKKKDRERQVEADKQRQEEAERERQEEENIRLLEEEFDPTDVSSSSFNVGDDTQYMQPPPAPSLPPRTGSPKAVDPVVFEPGFDIPESGGAPVVMGTNIKNPRPLGEEMTAADRRKAIEMEARLAKELADTGRALDPEIAMTLALGQSNDTNEVLDFMNYANRNADKKCVRLGLAAVEVLKVAANRELGQRLAVLAENSRVKAEVKAVKQYAAVLQARKAAEKEANEKDPNYVDRDKEVRELKRKLAEQDPDREKRVQDLIQARHQNKIDKNHLDGLSAQLQRESEKHSDHVQAWKTQRDKTLRAEFELEECKKTNRTLEADAMLNSQWKEKHDILAAEIKQLKVDLEKTDMLEEENEKLEKENRELKRRSGGQADAALKEENEQLKAELAQLRQENSIVNVTNRDLEKALSTYKERIDFLNRKVSDLEEENIDLQGEEKDNLQKAIHTLVTENKKLKDDLETNSTSNAKLISELMTLKTTIREEYITIRECDERSIKKRAALDSIIDKKANAADILKALVRKISLLHAQGCHDRGVEDVLSQWEFPNQIEEIILIWKAMENALTVTLIQLRKATGVCEGILYDYNAPSDKIGKDGYPAHAELREGLDGIIPETDRIDLGGFIRDTFEYAEAKWTEPGFAEKKKEEFLQDISRIKQDYYTEKKEREDLQQELLHLESLHEDLDKVIQDHEAILRRLGVDPSNPDPQIITLEEREKKSKEEIAMLERMNKDWESKFLASVNGSNKDGLQTAYDEQLKLAREACDKKADQIIALNKEKRELIAENEKIKETEKEVKLAKEEISDLQKRLKTLDVDITNEEELQNLRSTVIDLEVQLKAAKGAVRMLKDKTDTQAEICQKTISELEIQLEEANKKLEEQLGSSEVQSLRDQINKLEKELEDKKLKIDECEERSSTQLKKINALEKQGDDPKDHSAQELNELKKKIDVLSAELESQKQKTANCEKRSTNQLQTINELEKKANSKETPTDKDAIIAELNSQLAELRRQMEDHAKIVEANADAEEALERMGNELKVRTRELKECRDSSAPLRLQLVASKDRVSSLNGTIKGNAKIINRLRKDIKVLEAKVRELQKQLDSVKGDATLDTDNQALLSGRQQIGELERRIKELESQLAAANTDETGNTPAQLATKEELVEKEAEIQKLKAALDVANSTSTAPVAQGSQPSSPDATALLAVRGSVLAELDRAKSELERTKARETKLRSDMLETQQGSMRKDIEIERLKKIQSATSTTPANATQSTTAELGILLEQLVDKEDEIKRLKEQAASSNSSTGTKDTADLRDRYNNAMSDNWTLKNRIRKLEESNTGLKDLNRQDERRCEEEKEDLRQRINDLEQRKDGDKPDEAALVKCEDEKDTLKQEIRALEDPLRNKNATQREKVKEAQKEAQGEMKISPASIELALFQTEIALKNLAANRAIAGLVRGDAEFAVSCAQDAVDIAAELDDKAIIARCNYWAGIAYYYADEQNTSIAYFEDAMKGPSWTSKRPEADLLPKWRRMAEDSRCARNAESYGGSKPDRKSTKKASKGEKKRKGPTKQERKEKRAEEKRKMNLAIAKGISDGLQSQRVNIIQVPSTSNSLSPTELTLRPNLEWRYFEVRDEVQPAPGETNTTPAESSQERTIVTRSVGSWVPVGTTAGTRLPKPKPAERGCASM